mmetsp:Transcript_83124/g.201475  ORF Transcript_83124/g.201475 Transcript_83124/m.201475 type:complete len:218 (-) Transcript_83124:7-660(-)
MSQPHQRAPSRSLCWLRSCLTMSRSRSSQLRAGPSAARSRLPNLQAPSTYRSQYRGCGNADRSCPGAHRCPAARTGSGTCAAPLRRCFDWPRQAALPGATVHCEASADNHYPPSAQRPQPGAVRPLLQPQLSAEDAVPLQIARPRGWCWQHPERTSMPSNERPALARHCPTRAGEEEAMGHKSGACLPWHRRLRPSLLHALPRPRSGAGSSLLLPLS